MKVERLSTEKDELDDLDPKFPGLKVDSDIQGSIISDGRDYIPTAAKLAKSWSQ